MDHSEAECMPKFNCIRDAAVYAGVSVATLSAWMKNGIIKFDRISRTEVEFEPFDVDEVMKVVKEIRLKRGDLLKQRRALDVKSLELMRLYDLKDIELLALIRKGL